MILEMIFRCGSAVIDQESLIVPKAMVIDHIREAPCGHLEEHFEISDNSVSIIKTGREEANYKEIEYQ